MQASNETPLQPDPTSLEQTQRSSYTDVTRQRASNRQRRGSQGRTGRRVTGQRGAPRSAGHQHPSNRNQGDTPNPAGDTATNSQQEQQLPTRPPVPVAGKRRIWGTLKACSSQAVKCAINQLTAIGEDKIQVKRKYKTLRNNRLRWWHVVSGEEADLQQLESEWDKVQVQTNWKLEACLVNPSFLEEKN